MFPHLQRLMALAGNGRNGSTLPFSAHSPLPVTRAADAIFAAYS